MAGKLKRAGRLVAPKAKNAAQKMKRPRYEGGLGRLRIKTDGILHGGKAA